MILHGIVHLAGPVYSLEARVVLSQMYIMSSLHPQHGWFQALTRSQGYIEGYTAGYPMADMQAMLCDSMASTAFCILERQSNDGNETTSQG